MNSLTISLIVLAAATIFCFAAGVRIRNYSHVDRLWSMLPPIYVIIWWTGPEDTNIRFIAVALMVILWGTRLTANFTRGATNSVHESGISVLFLIILFSGSTVMAESITSGKYSSYRDWKGATPRWIPFLDYPFHRKNREAFWKLL